MNNILRELTAQIVGLFFAYEINNENASALKERNEVAKESLKAGNEVAKAFETILLHSKEAEEIARKDREVSEQHGFKATFSVEEMRKRAVLLAADWNTERNINLDNQNDADSSETQADVDNYNHFYNR